MDKKWTKDTNGCLGLRNKELAEKLIVKYKLKNTCKNNFIKVFGEPNNTEGNLFEKRLFYLEGSSCENNENNPNSENCFVIFVFQFNELKEFYEQCE